jgi:hypothetical protein
MPAKMAMRSSVDLGNDRSRNATMGKSSGLSQISRPMPEKSEPAICFTLVSRFRSRPTKISLPRL